MNRIKPTVSIIVPLYNDKKFILETLKRIEKAKIPGFKKEIIVVDDYSTDGGRELIKKYKNKYKIILHKKNIGVGGALRSGIKVATGEYIVRQDDDLEYDPNDIFYLLHPLITNQADIVYGSRTLNKNNDYSKKSYYWGGRLLNLIFNILYLNTISDFITGSKVFKRSVFNNLHLETNGFEIESEISAKATKEKYRIVSLPIAYRSRSFEEGKNIRWYHAFSIIVTLIKYRF
ncbi:MAG: glycosyltransferase family 2 protein [Candidatus Levybacteria bacterium]|nr:glycosyltransferase family 2 protein [Candidatus Levybacteria bacterium]